MIIDIYFKEFFKNPFFWWSAFIAVITTFHSYEPFFRIVEVILLQQLYVPILYGSVGLSLYLLIYPIRSRLKILKIFQDGKKEFAVYGILFTVIVLHTVYFSSDPPIMLTKVQSQIVTDKVFLEEANNLKIWAEYLVLPFLYAILVTQTRMILFGKEHPKFDSYKGSWKIAVVASILVFLAYLFFRVMSPMV